MSVAIPLVFDLMFSDCDMINGNILGDSEGFDHPRLPSFTENFPFAFTAIRFRRSAFAFALHSDSNRLRHC
jgi:hypothetical protein